MENKLREKLLEDMECDELCFMGTKKDLKENVKEIRREKDCGCCNC